MVSVALCTYNGEEYLEEQLDSLFAQTYPIDEIIVCDDCSTDSTLQILQKYTEKHPNIIQIVQNKKHLGTTKNYEKAINLCTKDLVFICDQDDIWLKDKVAKIVRVFEQNPEKKAVFHNLFLYKNGESLPFTMWDVLGFTPNVQERISLLKFLLLFGNLVTGMALAIRKPSKPIALSSDGGIRFLHDYLLAFTYASKEELLPLDECLGYYRKHPKQQVGYEEYKLDNDYYKRLYDNPLCLYVHLHFRMQHLNNYKTIHPQMKEFILQVKNEQKQAKDNVWRKGNLSCMSALKFLPSFIGWFAIKLKIRWHRYSLSF